MPDLYIYDVSEHQGSINWPAYPSQATIVRLNYGFDYPDKKATANLVGARARCRARGWYTYLRAGQAPEAQAQLLADILTVNGGLQQGEFIACDDEEGAGDQAPRVHAYFDWLHTRFQEDAGQDWVYSGLNFARAHLGSLSGVHRWLAAYGQGEMADQHDLWQFTSSATAAGISGPVDCSIYHGTIDQLLALVGGDMGLTLDEHQKLDEVWNFLFYGSDSRQPGDSALHAGLTAANASLDALSKRLDQLQQPTVDVQALATALAPHLPPSVDPAVVARDVLVGLGKALGSATP